MIPAPSHTAPPRLEPGSIERTRLLARMAAARHKSCMLILGPAGSGKTTLALQWRTQAMAYGHDVAWMTAMPGDDTHTVLEALLRALDRVDPLIAREARFLYNRDSELRSPDALAISLLRNIAQRSRPLVLMIDDCQNINDARIYMLLQIWLDFAPAGFHLVLLSRSSPPLALARLRAKDGLMELDYPELRFSLDEVQSFVASRHPGRSPREAARLLELTDGWAAGMQLVSMDFQRQHGQPEHAGPVQNPHDFTAYFHREVLSHLESEALDAMACLATARGFNLALVTALAGEVAGPALLDRMRREHLFVLPLDGAEAEGWYRFHPLFRDLLTERFAQLHKERQQHTHALLSAWFGQRKHLGEAVRHGVLAGQLEQAADWVDRWARELFLRGDLQKLVRAVSELPRAVVHGRPSMLLWLGWSQLCYRQPDACHTTLQVLRDQTQADDRHAQAQWLLLAFSLALQEDDFTTAQTLMAQMQAMRQGHDAVLTGGRRNLLSWIHTHQRDFTQARLALKGPPPLRDDGTVLLDSPFGALMGQTMLGLSYLHAGDMRQAEPVLRDALTEAERSLGPYSEPGCNAAAFLSAALYEANDLPALRTLLDSRYDAIERVALPDALITVAVARTRLRRFDGQPHEALEGLERLEDIAQRRGHERAMAFALSERLRTRLAMHEDLAAHEALQRLQTMAQRHASASVPPSRRIVGLAGFAAALVHSEAREDRAAIECLEPLCKAPDPTLLGRDAITAHALHALLLARVGQQALALERLTETLRQAQRMGLLRSLLDLGEELLALARACVQGAGEADPMVAFYVDLLHAQAGLHQRPALPTTLPLREPLSERELDILRALAHSMSNKRIAQALGVSPETVKWHLKNVYGKLGVFGRDDAVARARDLGLA